MALESLLQKPEAGWLSELHGLAAYWILIVMAAREVWPVQKSEAKGCPIQTTSAEGPTRRQPTFCLRVQISVSNN